MSEKKNDFSLYGSWEDLVACKILLRDVGIICPPGKPNYENFFGGTILDDLIEFVQIAPRSLIYVLIWLFFIVPGAI